MTWRAVNAGMALLLVVFALLQLNDPDPVRWVVLYGLGAAYSAPGAFGAVVSPGPVIVYGVLCAALGGMTLYVGAGTSTPMGDPSWGPLADEGVREALGLFLMAGWMLTLGVGSALRRRAAAGGGEG